MLHRPLLKAKFASDTQADLVGKLPAGEGFLQLLSQERLHESDAFLRPFIVPIDNRLGHLLEKLVRSNRAILRFKTRKLSSRMARRFNHDMHCACLMQSCIDLGAASRDGGLGIVFDAAHSRLDREKRDVQAWSIHVKESKEVSLWQCAVSNGA